MAELDSSLLTHQLPRETPRFWHLRGSSLLCLPRSQVRRCCPGARPMTRTAWTLPWTCLPAPGATGRGSGGGTCPRSRSRSSGTGCTSTVTTRTPPSRRKPFSPSRLSSPRCRYEHSYTREEVLNLSAKHSSEGDKKIHCRPHKETSVSLN